MNTPATYSNWQSVLLYTAAASAISLSLLGSAGIISLAQSKLKNKRDCHNEVYQRLMIFLSSCDIAVGVTYLIVPWLFPPVSPNNPLAHGNDLTCTISGVFVQTLTFVTPINGCNLSLYFLFSVKYGWRERDIKTYLEMPAYAMGALFLIGFDAAALALNLHQPVPTSMFCWPAGESDAHRVFSWVETVFQAVLAIVGIGATYLVYRHVFHVTHASRELDAGSSTNPTDPRQKRLKAVAVQAVLYIMALMNTVLVPTVLKFLLTYTSLPEEPHKWYWYTLTIVGFILFPLNGFFNFCIYSRARIKAWKKAHSEISWLTATWWAVMKPQDPPRNAASVACSKRVSQRSTRVSNVAMPSSSRKVDDTSDTVDCHSAMAEAMARKAEFLDLESHDDNNQE